MENCQTRKIFSTTLFSILKIVNDIFMLIKYSCNYRIVDDDLRI